jgi:hypothetical protein
MDQKVRYLKNSKETREGGNLMKKHRESIVIKSDPGLTRIRGRVSGFMSQPESTRVNPEKLKKH